jgi:hypothetical protein
MDTLGGPYPTEVKDGIFRSKHSTDPNSPWYGARLRDAVSAEKLPNWPSATTSATTSDTHTGNLKSTQQKPGSMHSVTLAQAAERLWPTARTVTSGAESAKRKKELGRTASGGGDLQSEVLKENLWPTATTPAPHDSEKTAGRTDRPQRPGYGLDLPSAVGKEETLYPTPRARDFTNLSNNPETFEKRWNNVKGKTLPEFIQRQDGLLDPDKFNKDGSRPASSQEKNAWATPRAGKTTDEDPETWKKRQEKGEVSTMPLGAQAKAWATPRQVMDSGPHGKRVDTLHSQMKAESSAKLNPRWVETLMGLQMGWTSPDCPASVIRNWPRFVLTWCLVQIVPTSSASAATVSSRPPQLEPGGLFSQNSMEENNERK